MAYDRNYYIQKTTNEFLKWKGYMEKAKASNVANTTYDNPGGYTANAGKNNWTIFSKVYYEMTGINVQGMAWCDSFVDTIFIHLYGVATAKALLGGFSAYTPTSASYFKNIDRWYTSNPQAGDIIFFKNSTRIYHTGYVYKVDNIYVYTCEGNTSSGTSVVANGGEVACKYYKKTNTAIAGYGRPNYDMLVTEEPETTTNAGWRRAADGKRWWYETDDGGYCANRDGNNGWYAINGYWYNFDTNGYMLTGYQEINGKYYILCPDEKVNYGSDEGKCMISDEKGALTPLKAS